MTTSTDKRMLFVNIPVVDVARTQEFFSKLGFEFDARFSGDDSVATMMIGDDARVMFGTREKWAEFSKLPMADPRTYALALYNFTVSSREEVDTVTDAAVAAGAEDHNDAQDYGFMYSRSFFDLDGHGWQVMWMDPAAAEMTPEDFAAQEAGANS